MKLSHVCMWSEHGWKRVTAEEAAAMFPMGKVSAHSGLFMCELCGQYVSLTEGRIYKRHFKHSKDEIDKDCPERTIGYNQSLPLDMKTREIPMKLRILSTSSFEMLVGMIPPPQGVVKDSSVQKIKISSSDAAESYIYSAERLMEGVTTYLSIGGSPRDSYTIDLIPRNNALRECWPEKISGISPIGTIFDGQTGRKLPMDSDVAVGHKYYLLTRNRFSSSVRGISIREVCRSFVNNKFWYIYELEANKFEASAARFFLNYHYRLSENSVSIIPIWPAVIHSPCVIHTDTNDITLFIQGNCNYIINPRTEVRCFPCETGKILLIEGVARNRLLSVGRSRVLDYTYFRKGKPSAIVDNPQVCIEDIGGNSLEEDIIYDLSPNRCVYVTAPFDGKIIIRNKNEIKRIIKIPAKKRVLIDEITYGMSISVVQGLDEIRVILFEKKEETDERYDAVLYKKLEACRGNYISVTHDIGALVSKMNGYPQTRKWLYRHIRRGKMPQKAYKVLIKHFC